MLKNNLEISHTNYFIINENSKIIGKFNTSKRLSYKNLLKSCDIGLSTIILNKNFFYNNKFSKLKTKEDYVVWLRLVKNKVNDELIYFDFETTGLNPYHNRIIEKIITLMETIFKKKFQNITLETFIRLIISLI